jgi:1-phosphatidylinositol-4-phosphate 5-kinase
MIKTQTNEENKFLKRILPHYYQYITEHPDTMLVRIYAMHRVKMYHLHRKVHFVIMASVFDTPEQIHRIYDLKGSSLGRTASQHDRESGGVLKDNDLISDDIKLQLGSKKKAFMEQLTKDAMFLAKLNIMDYSMLVRSLTIYTSHIYTTIVY